MEAKLVKTGRLILSVLFIFSGISKLLSLPFFDGMVAELFIGTDFYNYPNEMWYSQMFTRLIISGEILLGAAMLQERYFKSIILPIVQVMLLAFTAHLFYAGFERGFVDGNCGCFGDILPMTNLESIIKNVVAMGIAMFLWQFHVEVEIMRFRSWVMPAIIGGVTMATLLLTIKDYAPSTMVNVPTENIQIIQTQSGSNDETEATSNENAEAIYDELLESEAIAAENGSNGTTEASNDYASTNATSEGSTELSSNTSQTAPEATNNNSYTVGQAEAMAQAEAIINAGSGDIKKDVTPVAKDTEPKVAEQKSVAKTETAPKKEEAASATPQQDETQLASPPVVKNTKELLGKHLIYSNGAKVDLDKGKKLICMFSFTCGHCQDAYKELCAMQKDGGLADLYIFGYGTDFDKQYFLNLAPDCKKYIWSTKDYGDFKRVLEGEDFPRILAFDNGDIVGTWTTENYSEKALRDFYKIEKKKHKPAAAPGEIFPTGGGAFDSPW
ncbi:MAG: hypothetical protein HRT71_12085 [Flavobacteriales bacterium]|nr:hypothetical protein [Flavobacteriales bacterium]